MSKTLAKVDAALRQRETELVRLKAEHQALRAELTAVKKGLSTSSEKAEKPHEEGQVGLCEYTTAYWIQIEVQWDLTCLFCTDPLVCWETGSHGSTRMSVMNYILMLFILVCQTEGRALFILDTDDQRLKAELRGLQEHLAVQEEELSHQQRELRQLRHHWEDTLDHQEAYLPKGEPLAVLQTFYNVICLGSHQ